MQVGCCVCKRMIPVSSCYVKAHLNTPMMTLTLMVVVMMFMMIVRVVMMIVIITTTIATKSPSPKAALPQHFPNDTFQTAPNDKPTESRFETHLSPSPAGY